MAKLDLKEILRKVLIDNDITEDKFSMDGYKEDATCIEKTSEGYIVYYAIEGKKCLTTKCARLLDACYELIKYVTRTNSDMFEIKTIFADNVILEALEELGIED